jgi:signal transduction histidine kinase/ActR/RegA family two-component response regulator
MRSLCRRGAENRPSYFFCQGGFRRPVCGCQLLPERLTAVFASRTQFALYAFRLLALQAGSMHLWKARSWFGGEEKGCRIGRHCRSRSLGFGATEQDGSVTETNLTQSPPSNRPRALVEQQDTEQNQPGWNPVSLRALVAACGWRSPKLWLVLLCWAAFVFLCVQSGRYFTAHQLVDFHFSISSLKPEVTLFPPVILCVIALFALGLEWAIIPSYLSTLAVCLDAGLSPFWSALVSLGDPLALFIVALAYRSAASRIKFGSLTSTVWFFAVAVTASLTSSIGSLVYSEATHESASAAFASWTGWGLGDCAAAFVCVWPCILIVRHGHKLRSRFLPDSKETSYSFGSMTTCIAGAGLVIAAFLLASADSAKHRLQAVLASSVAPRVWPDVWDAVATWQLAAWCSFVLVIGLTIGAIALAHWWSKRWDTQRAALEQATGAARLASLAKSSFLATVAHDLRTPMNGVLGMNELLLKTDLTPEQRDYASTVQESGRILLHLLNEVLDMSKIEAGKLELAIISFDLNQEFTLLAKLLQPDPKHSLTKLSFSVDGSIPRRILGDPDRLRQVLVNLIGNAIKFTPSGFVSVSAKLQGFAADGRVIEFTVKDSGIGMSPETMARLFQPFTQADSSTSRKFGGTGLGLCISKQLVQLMGGELSLTSIAGSGSTLSFRLPLAIPAETAWENTRNHEPAPASLSHLRVLVADDNQINRKVAAKMLEHLGCSVWMANSGIEAVDCVAVNRFDIVLMDCQMPEMDGYEATAKIQQRMGDGKTEARPRIIAMTASAMTEDRQRCLDAGMDDYLAKPFTAAALRDALLRNMKNNPETA